jgi:hypothetical protein
MRYLCLIYLSEREMEVPRTEVYDLDMRQASQFPSDPHAAVEVWPTRELVIDGGPG